MPSSKIGSCLPKVKSFSESILRKLGKKEQKGDGKKSAQDPFSNDKIPGNILAFRTITKLLGTIQQDREPEVELWQSELTEAEIVELKISDAFATIAVTEHEVVAVTTNQRIHPKTLQVVASIQPSDDNSSPPTQASTSAASECPIWTFTFNTRWSDEDPTTSLTAEPTIFDVASLAGINLDNDMKIKEFAVKSRRVLTEDEKIKIYAEQHW